MSTNAIGESKPEISESPIPMDYVVVSTPECLTGLIHIEARVQDDVELEDMTMASPYAQDEFGFW